mgnify:CR=1 FL=1
MIRNRRIALTAHQVTLRYLRDLARDLGCEARGAAMRSEPETEAARTEQRERIQAALDIVEGRKP